MIAVSKKFSVVLSALLITAVTISGASAQPSAGGFGSQQVNQFKVRSSANFFNTDRIQRRLQARSVTRDLFAPRSTSPSRPAAKPFSTINRGPTVSPYLALNNPLSQASDYFNIVRPRQEQQRINQQQQRVNQQLLRQNLSNQHRLNQIAAAGPFNPKGSENFAPTGHAAGHQQLGNYLNFGGYFPPPSSPKR